MSVDESASGPDQKKFREGSSKNGLKSSDMDESNMNVDESVGGSEQNNWTRVDVLGSGSFGIVSLWKRLEEQIAVKVFRFPADNSRDQGVKDKFKNRCKDEVERMYKIKCKYIVGTIEIPTELKELIQWEILSTSNHNYADLLLQSPLLGMEYCSGGDLQRILSQPEHLNGLPEEEVLAVLGNISEAIQYLHSVPIGGNRFIIHRDIKPGNIVIQLLPGNKRVYKLSDLGLAKDIKDVSVCSSGVGTLVYMAPEIVRGGRGKYKKTVDYWSFGLIAYEISCGTLPPKKDDKHVLEIPPRTHLSKFFRICLDKWIPTMVEYDPENRGKLPVGTDGKEICSFAWLQGLLKGSYLQVYTCMKGRLVFRVDDGMTIAKVQEYIAHEDNTGISIEDQLLLTADGTEVSPDELALTKANTNCKLYLLAKFGKQICSEIKADNVLFSFLEQDPNSFSSTFDQNEKLMKKLRRIGVFCVQTQLERTQNLLTIEKALKDSIRGRKTDSDMRDEMMRMDQLHTQLGNHRATLAFLVKYHQERLDQIGKEVASELGDYPSLSDIKKSADDFHDRIETYFRQYRMFCNDNGLQNLKPTSDSDLKKMQESLIDEIKHWNAIPRTENVTSTLKNVHGMIWSFLKTQQSILTDLEDNIQVLLLRGGDSYYRRVKHLLQESESFLHRVTERGEKIQEMICNLNRCNHPGGFSTESTSSISSIALENCIDILLD